MAGPRSDRDQDADATAHPDDADATAHPDDADATAPDDQTWPILSAPDERFVIPPRLRVATWFAFCAALAPLVFLTWTVRSSPGPSALDVSVQAGSDRMFENRSHLAWLLIQFGDPLPLIFLALLLAFVAHRLGRTPIAVLVILGGAMVGAVTTILELYVGRKLEGVLAFPSGHTAGLTVLAAAIALLVLGHVGSRLYLAAVAAALGVTVTAATIGTALVAYGSHYATDVIGGFCTALVVVIATAAALDVLSVSLRDDPM